MAYYNSWADDIDDDGGTDGGGTVDSATVSPWADDGDDDDGDDSGTVDLGTSTGGDLLDAYDGDDSDDSGSTTPDLTTTSDDDGDDGTSGSSGSGDDGVVGDVIENEERDLGLDDGEQLAGGNLGAGGLDDETVDAIEESLENAAEDTDDVQAMVAELQAAYEARIEALMNDLPIPDRLGGSSEGGGLSPALGGVALLAVGGGALYYSEAS